MTEKQLQQANDIHNRLEAKKKELKVFEMGKILSITVRTFNDDKTEYEDIEYSSNLPRVKLKGVMLDLLKSDRDSLQRSFDNYLSEDNQIVGGAMNDLGIYYTPEKVDNFLKVAVNELAKEKEVENDK